MSPIITRDPVLITGGAGFIGANLVNKLLDLGYKNINLLIRNSTDLKRLKNVLPKIRLHEVDLLDKDELKTIVEKINPSIIIHLATYSAYRDHTAALEMIEVNIKGTMNLLISSKDINYKIFINTGSSSEYGIKENPMKEDDILEPISFYAATKASATLLCQVFSKEHQKPIVTLRPFSVFGPHEEEKRFIPIIIKAAIQRHPIKLTSGTQRRDFVYIKDVVDIYIKTISKGKELSGQILNMGTGLEFTNDEVVEKLFKVTGKKVKIEKGVFPKRLWDTSHWVADISKTKKYLDWEPKYSLEEGLKETYQWFKKYL
ncbi:MAG: NAD-dependent epimerase/dehydratase family protein [Candidatus Levybacteria bacterium]|nr:NAD-dependent epimerase/dehydratase family protein [Candidatus Levybacteria bacterium]